MDLHTATPASLRQQINPSGLARWEVEGRVRCEEGVGQSAKDQQRLEKLDNPHPATPSPSSSPIYLPPLQPEIRQFILSLSPLPTH